MKKIQLILKTIFSLCLLILFFLSCQKDRTKSLNRLPTLYDFIAFSKKDHSTVALTLDKEYDDRQKVYPRLEATFINEKNPRGPLKKIGEIDFDGYKLKPNSQNVYDNKEDLLNSETHRTFLRGLFGKNVNVKINYDTLNNQIISLRESNEVSGQFYIPKEIDGILQLLPPNAIMRNSFLSWTPDANNTKGVYIIVRFDSKEYGNELFSNSQSFHKVIQTDDTGMYNFSSNDFSDIPINAFVEINWGRGNYLELSSQNTSNNVLLMSYSSKRKRVKIL